MRTWVAYVLSPLSPRCLGGPGGQAVSPAVFVCVWVHASFLNRFSQPALHVQDVPRWRTGRSTTHAPPSARPPAQAWVQGAPLCDGAGNTFVRKERLHACRGTTGKTGKRNDRGRQTGLSSQMYMEEGKGLHLPPHPGATCTGMGAGAPLQAAAV